MGHIIQNFDSLAENEQRKDALAIAEAGYEAINIGAAIRRKVQVVGDEMRIGYKSYSLANRKVFFIGIGKCAFAAAKAIEAFLGERLTAGIAFDVSPLPQNLTKIKAFVGTHPLPSEENVRVTNHIIEFLSQRTEEDLIVMLISGGGSTLLCSPKAPMEYQDEVTFFKELTAKGATIQDMNTVRKHTSRARGGWLARAAYPSEVISLIASDVPGNDIELISSGPTVLDSSTISDAEKVLAQYGIDSSKISLLETPKEEKYFKRVANIIFLSNQNALSAMRDEARQLGYTVEIVDEQFAGEARDIGRAVVEKLHTAPAKTALLYAGESTVALSSTSLGAGGRNQEMALATLETIRHDELILPFASDGHDNTDNAGAIGDDLSRAHAIAKNLSTKEYLDAHRSYEFFSTTRDALQTGYTGSNVSDLIVALKN